MKPKPPSKAKQHHSAAGERLPWEEGITPEQQEKINIKKAQIDLEEKRDKILRMKINRLLFFIEPWWFNFITEPVYIYAEPLIDKHKKLTN